jgi:heme exporter protein A
MDLILSDVACARGGVRVLEGISLCLSGGQAMVLRGANGIGKTTLLRTIAGLQPPAAGRIVAPPEAVAYAAHADGLKGALSVEENLRFWAAIHGQDGVDAALGAMDLGGLRDRPARNLSAGQKRRLGLARILVTGRPVWLMDEPTVSLDAGSVALFVDAVRAHLAAGGAALIASHVDFGLVGASGLDLGPFRARGGPGAGAGAFDEAVG